MTANDTGGTPRAAPGAADVIAEIRAFIVTRHPELVGPELTEDTPLFSEGWLSSLEFLELMSRLDSRFGVRLADVPGLERDQIDTMTQIAAVVAGLRGQPEPVAPQREAPAAAPPDEAEVNFNSGLALLGPINTLVYFLVHLATLALFYPAVRWTAAQGTLALLSFLSICFVLFPTTVMLLFGLLLRIAPKPREGPIRSNADALKYMFLTGLHHMTRFSAARPALASIPFPGMLFYLAAGCRIHPSVVLASPEVVSEPFMLSIGANSTLGNGSLVSGHAVIDARTTLLGSVQIGKNVLVGANSLIGPGTQIGDGVILEPNSFVPFGAHIPAHEQWGGHPARKIKNLRS